MKLAEASGAEPRFLISDLLAYLETYLPHDQISEVYRAYLFGADAHINQKRLSGEPYIYHPIAVARILAGLRLDYKCLMAAILHDVIEDTPTAKAQLQEQFDNEVADLVDGVTKLTHLDFSTREEAQAASLQKMILAMTKDIRVILVKLADRLHNMRTLGVMRPEKARRIASETLEIYAPIAQRLGMNNIRHELEDLAFAAHWPWRYQILRDAVNKHFGHRKELISGILTTLRRQLMQDGIHAEVIGRKKHLYSIYLKMRDRGVPYEHIADMLGFRIIVDSVDDCYRTLGVVHHTYKPRPGGFKDYIAIPKSSGYQSLHTQAIGPHGKPMEVQIRTEAMHQVAETGVAAHWNYKSGEEQGQRDGPGAEWFRNLLELQRGSATPLEFLEHVKVDLFPGEVYVFTPKGKIMALPRGSTVLDFAYAIHTDVGNHCVAARIDNRMVPLRTQLHNGETIEVHTSPNATPNPRWLDFAVTSKARANIRSFLNNLQHQEAVNLGARLLGAEFELYDTALEHLGKQSIDELVASLGYEDFDDLLEDIGLGNRPARLVVRSLMEEGDEEDSSVEEKTGRHRVAIKGTEGMVVNYARCCHPIPGDDIVGTFHPGKGIVVHHASCPNLGDMRKYSDRWVDVQWEDEVSGDFSVALRVEVTDRPGVLAMTAAAIADAGANIESVRAEEHDGRFTSLDFVVTATGRKHLAKIMRSLRRVPAVNRLARMIS